MKMNKTHKLQDPNFVRLDCTIPSILKEKLTERSKQLGLNLKSTIIVILNKEFNLDGKQTD